MSARIRSLLTPLMFAAVFLSAAPALAGTVESLMARAHAAEANGKSNEAVGLMQAAVVADPARAATYVALADLYARLREHRFAAKYYDEALYIDPVLPAALLGAGRTALALGDRAAAADKLARLERSCGPDCGETRALRTLLAPGKNAEADAAPSSLDKH